jgi:hypothetical protein
VKVQLQELLRFFPDNPEKELSALHHLDALLHSKLEG